MKQKTYHPRGKKVHGFAPGQHPLYSTWANMIARCYNPECASWHNYGGRGIDVCSRWHHFENFALDMGLRPDDSLTLERQDNSLGYGPENCVWATHTDQCHNRRTFRNNTTGVTGVVRMVTPMVRYEARWDHEHTRYRVGRFDTPEEAAVAREAFIGLFYTDRDAALDMVAGETLWCTSTTGVRGVTPHVDGGFMARTTVAGVRKYLGYFKTVEEAAAAISEAKEKDPV